MKKLTVFMIVVLLFSVLVGVSAFAENEEENPVPIPTPTPTPVLIEEEVPTPEPLPETNAEEEPLVETPEEEPLVETPEESQNEEIETPSESPKPEVSGDDLLIEDQEQEKTDNRLKDEPEDEIEVKPEDEEDENEAEDKKESKNENEQEPPDQELRSEAEGENEPEEGEAQDELTEKTGQEEEQKEAADLLKTEAEDTETASEQDVPANQQEYSLTFSNGTKSFETKGGTQITLKDILSALGYSVENAVITVNPDSVDTSVIQITESENGLVLTDFGPFAQADRILTVYIDGEPVELSVVDPVDAKGDYTANNFQNLFTAGSGQDGHVKLVGNVKITDSGTIRLASGVHNLFLNGFTLNLNGGTIVNESEATLNIFGGANSTESGNGTITTSGTSGSVVALKNEGTLNVYSGNIEATATTGSASAVENTNTVAIYGGNISASANKETYSYAVNSAAVKAKTYITGGTFQGKLNLPAGKQTLGTITVSGGRFTTDPSAYVVSGYVVLDHGTSEKYRYEVVKQPESPKTVIDVEVLNETDLNNAQQQSLKKITDEVIHILRCSFWQGQYSVKSAQKIVIRKALLENNKIDGIRIWHMAEDGTLTEVKFETNSAGEIVINNGKPGIYVLAKAAPTGKGK